MIVLREDVVADPGLDVGYAWGVEMYAADAWRPDITREPGRDLTLLPALGGPTITARPAP